MKRSGILKLGRTICSMIRLYDSKYFFRRQIATVLNGKDIAEDILNELKKEVAVLKNLTKPSPCLAVILVGENPASITYVNNKIIAAAKIGIKADIFRFASTISQNELVNTIQELNNDPATDGILLQLPLPQHICDKTVCDVISPEKDVDGFTSINFGKFCLGIETIVACTPLAVCKFICQTGVDLTGKNAVVCGRSKHVGLPIALLLQGMDVTTTICHRNTPLDQLISFAKTADIIVSATGVPELIRGHMIKDGAIVIDVGITKRINDKTQKSELVGDVCFAEVHKVAGYITPVPGGVGPVTVAMLMKNTLLVAKQRRKLV